MFSRVKGRGFMEVFLARWRQGAKLFTSLAKLLTNPVDLIRKLVQCDSIKVIVSAVVPAVLQLWYFT